jgi:hypothetical protein
VIDYFLVYQFIKRLATPFSEWSAFKLGIIDERGNILRKRRELKTTEERRAFGVFDVMVLNLKKLLERLPAGQTRIASYAAALWLIREHKAFTPDSLLTEQQHVSDQQLLESAELFFSSYTDYTTLIESVKQKTHDLDRVFEERFLNEAFDKPYPFKLENVTPNRLEAKARLPDDSVLTILFLYSFKYDGWEVVFDRDMKMDVTGLGDQFRIFATVIEALKKFIASKSPNTIRFGADKSAGKDSRAKLYDRMVKTFANKYGYQLKKTEYKYGAQYFELTKMSNEDAPTNSVSAGGVSGLTVDDLPGVTRKQQRAHQKRTSKGKRLRDIIGDLT